MKAAAMAGARVVLMGVVAAAEVPAAARAAQLAAWLAAAPVRTSSLCL